MTTGVYDGKYLAIDSLCTYDNGSIDSVDELKLVIGDLGVAMISGTYSLALKLANSLVNSKATKIIDFKHEKYYYDVLFVPKKGPPKMYDSNGIVEIPARMPITCGSGRDFAKGAVMQGADAMEAVRIAGKAEVWTGGDYIYYIEILSVVDGKREFSEIKSLKF